MKFKKQKKGAELKETVKQLEADLRVAKEKVVKSRRKKMELANDLVNPETSLRRTIVIKKQTVTSSSMIWEEKEKNND